MESPCLTLYNSNFQCRRRSGGIYLDYSAIHIFTPSNRTSIRLIGEKTAVCRWTSSTHIPPLKDDGVFLCLLQFSALVHAFNFVSSFVNRIVSDWMIVILSASLFLFSFLSVFSFLFVNAPVWLRVWVWSIKFRNTTKPSLTCWNVVNR